MKKCSTDAALSFNLFKHFYLFAYSFIFLRNVYFQIKAMLGEKFQEQT